MTLENYINYLVKWLQQQVKDANAKGLVLGVSGGIDSAVSAALVKKAMGDKHLVVFMPCYSLENDANLVTLLVNKLNLNLKTVDLSNTYDSLKGSLELEHTNEELTSKALANCKPRLRMTSLYALAQSLGYLVVGTSNWNEWYTGYFTKYGDGASDICPLIHLLKGQIKAIASKLDIPQEIIDVAPSAGLWEGQTDEAEMGVTYEQLDNFLSNNTSNLEQITINKIQTLHQNTEHKRNKIKIPKKWNKI